MDLAEEIIAQDFVEHNASSGTTPGLEGFKQFISMIGTAFPDISVKVEEIVAEENKVVARLTVSGTHKGMLMGSIPPTNKHATWTGIDIFAIADSKIKERWSQLPAIEMAGM
jgi:predicted ester cyclase